MRHLCKLLLRARTWSRKGGRQMGFFGWNLQFGGSSQESPPPPPPRRENWDIVSALGGGAQGLTYLVQRKPKREAGQLYVLKDLRRQDDPKARARFLREVTQLRHLQHRGVPRVIESNAVALESEEKLYLVLEHVPGPTLKQRVQTQPLSLADSLDLTLELLRILEYCHGESVIHRDVKPANIVLRDDSVTDPVIVDFGLSFNMATDDDLTMSSVGNSCLILPEQSATSSDRRQRESDVTQVCGILVYALTGSCPEHLLDAADRKPHRRPAFTDAVRECEAELVQRICEVLDRSFNRRFETRWRSANECRLALEEARAPLKAREKHDSVAGQLRAAFQNAAGEMVPKNLAALSEELEAATKGALNEVAKHFEDQFETTFAPSLFEEDAEIRHIFRFVPRSISLKGIRIEFRARLNQGFVHIDYWSGSPTAMTFITELTTFDVSDPVPVQTLKAAAVTEILRSLASLLPES